VRALAEGSISQPRPLFNLINLLNKGGGARKATAGKEMNFSSNTRIAMKGEEEIYLFELSRWRAP